MHRFVTYAKRIAALGKERFATLTPTPKHAKKESPLLRTYFSGLAVLVLCTTMLLSTTYAWFSSTVSNTGNEIYIGSLDIGLYKQDGDALLDLSDSNYRLFDDQIVWAPGQTAVETIYITNEGDLAFQYFFGFTNGALRADSTMAVPEVARHFEVWVFPHTDGVAPIATDYATITAADSGWTNAGTLDQLLQGHTPLQGTLNTSLAVEKPAGTATFTVALHMLDTADAAVMGQSLQLSVKLIAYQLGADALPEWETTPPPTEEAPLPTE